MANPLPEVVLKDISLFSMEFGMAAGGTSVLSFDGSSWSIEQEGFAQELVSVGVGSLQLAAVGGFTETGIINLMEWDGDDWSQVDLPEWRRFVTGIDFHGPDFGLAVTDRPGLVIRYDGQGWEIMGRTIDITGQAVALSDVCIMSPTRFIVTGWGASIIMYEDSNWTVVDTSAWERFATFWSVGCLKDQG